MNSNQILRWVVKPLVFLAALVPFALLVRRLTTGDLGADPLQTITDETGVWTLRFLAFTLTITPLRRLFNWNGAIKLRRMLGLFAFFYGSVHLLIFVVADRLASLGFPSVLQWQTIRDLTLSMWNEIYKRPYITVGMLAWVFMLALAATSTTGMIRRLGGKRWKALHRLVYGSAVLGVLHYWWLVKADVRNPAAYAIVIGLLLTYRLVVWARYRAGVTVRPVGARATTLPTRPT